MMELLWIVPVMIVFMVLKGFFSGSEIAIVNADKIKLRSQAKTGHRGAAAVLKSERNPELHLATTLVGTNLSIVILTTLGTLVMIRLFGDQGELYAIVLFSPLFLVLTEVVPKSIFQQRANELAPIVIWPLRAFMVILFPVIFTFARVARFAARLASGKKIRHVFMTREMVRALLDTAEKAADLNMSTFERLKRAVRLTDITVGEVMIPMAEVTAISHLRSTRDAIDLARSRGHFRLPVYEDSASNVLGVVALDMWKLMSTSVRETPLQDLVEPAEFVVPQQPVYELLPTLRQRTDHMAIVMDEFGSAIGMVTMEDIQESVVGEVVGVGFNIPGYVHRQKQLIEALGDGTYLINARVPVSEINDLLGTNLPVGEAYTIGGLVTARLRHMAKENEAIVAAGFRFTIAETTGRVISKLRVEPS